MNIKEVAIETIQRLPETVSWYEILETLSFIAGAYDGFKEIEEGKGIPIEQGEGIINSWDIE